MIGSLIDFLTFYVCSISWDKSFGCSLRFEWEQSSSQSSVSAEEKELSRFYLWLSFSHKFDWIIIRVLIRHPNPKAIEHEKYWVLTATTIDPKIAPIPWNTMQKLFRFSYPYSSSFRASTTIIASLTESMQAWEQLNRNSIDVTACTDEAILSATKASNINDVIASSLRVPI